MVEERRRAHRGRTYLGGQVSFNDRCSIADCVVRNLSAEGAKIVFSAPMTIPEHFDFTIRRKGESRRARIVWRREFDAGVVFLPSDPTGIVSIETARRFRKLEAERDRLAARVSELSESSC